MRDIGVFVTDYLIFFFFVFRSVVGIRVCAFVFFCDFLCIDTHFVSWHYRFLMRPPLEPRLGPILILSLSPHLLFPFLQHVDIASSATHLPFSSLCMTVHYLSRRIPFSSHLDSYTPFVSSLCLCYHHSLPGNLFLCLYCFFPCLIWLA
jgi:hypothetical protein